MIRAVIGAALATVMVGSPARALAQEAEEAAVVSVVTAMFDAMRAGDSAAMRATLHPSATMASAFLREGVPTLERKESMSGFLEAVGTPHEEVWDERIWDIEVDVDVPLATVWMKYAFYVGENFSHCGVDAFQLFKSPDGWQVFHIADTRRREGCETPGD